MNQAVFNDEAPSEAVYEAIREFNHRCEFSNQEEFTKAVNRLKILAEKHSVNAKHNNVQIYIDALSNCWKFIISTRIA